MLVGLEMTSFIKGHHEARQKAGGFDVDADPVISVWSNDKGGEAIGKADFDMSRVSNTDVGLLEDDLLIIGILQGTISIERMSELVLRYKVSPGYIYRIPTDDEYVSTLGHLEVGVCDKSF